MLSFGRTLRQTAPFYILELSFHVLRFLSWGIPVGRHSLLSLVIIVVGIDDTVSIFICVVRIEMCHDDYYGGCERSLKSRRVYLQEWRFVGPLDTSFWRHVSVPRRETSL